MIHLCWLTEPWKKSHEKYLAAWVELGWNVTLWADARSGLSKSPVAEVALRDSSEIASGSPIENVFQYAVRHQDHGTAACLFRYQVLTTLGGAYADLDVQPLDATPTLLERVEPGFALEQRLNLLEIRFITTPRAEHPLLIKLRDTAVENEAQFLLNGGWGNLASRAAMIHSVLDRAGPKMARIVIERYAIEHGLSLDEMILQNAVNELTPESKLPGFVDKQHIIRRIALSELRSARRA
jgi:hypothetical protein